METQTVIDTVKTVVPDAEVIPDGEGCNFNLTIISDNFAELRTLARQQKILGAFSDALRTGDIHALNIKAYTKEEWKVQKEKQQAVQIRLG